MTPTPLATSRRFPDAATASSVGWIRRRWRSLRPCLASRHGGGRSQALLVAALAVAAAPLRALWSERATTVVATDAQARERYLRAQFFYLRRAPGDLDIARRYFLEAVAIDPGYARAWAGLAGVYSIETNEGRRPPGAGFSLARRAATMADEPLGLAEVGVVAQVDVPSRLERLHAGVEPSSGLGLEVAQVLTDLRDAALVGQRAVAGHPSETPGALRT
jgi:hypothetical protein